MDLGVIFLLVVAGVVVVLIIGVVIVARAGERENNYFRLNQE